MESFFGIGGPEILLILVLATVVLGPLRMIRIARQLGILLRDLRNYYQSLTAGLSQELAALAEMEETVRGEAKVISREVEQVQSLSLGSEVNASAPSESASQYLPASTESAETSAIQANVNSTETA